MREHTNPTATHRAEPHPTSKHITPHHIESHHIKSHYNQTRQWTKTRIVSASDPSEKQTFHKQENIIDPQWKCEFANPASLPKGRKHYRSAVKLWILSTSQRAGKAENASQRSPRSPKRALPYFLIQTLKRKRTKNDPRENEENTLNECWIPPNRLKSRIRYETAAKI